MWGKEFMMQDIEKVLLDEETIAKRVQELGDEISKAYDGQEIVVICVLKGASIFFADLCRASSHEDGLHGYFQLRRCAKDHRYR